MNQRIFNVIISLAVFSLGIIALSDHHKINNMSIPTKAVPKVIIIDEPEFLSSDCPNRDLLIDALEYYDVKHPDIVYAQAILETGHFKSRVCKEYNNLFGLYNSYTKDYYKFDHWSDSVLAYVDMIQYKYQQGENYYDFLERIGYAEDPYYTNKVKSIVKQN